MFPKVSSVSTSRSSTPVGRAAPSVPSTPVKRAAPPSVPSTPDKVPPTPTGFSLAGWGFGSPPRTPTFSRGLPCSELTEKFDGIPCASIFDCGEQGEVDFRHIASGASAKVYAFDSLHLFPHLDSGHRYVLKVTKNQADAVHEAAQWQHLFLEPSQSLLKAILIIRSHIHSAVVDISVPDEAPLVGLVFQAARPARLLLDGGRVEDHHIGISVHDFMMHRPTHRLTTAAVLRILRAATEFVLTAHSGNRAVMDLSSNNILLSGTNLIRSVTEDAAEEWAVTLIDLGEATELDDGGYTRVTRKVAFDAPEFAELEANASDDDATASDESAWKAVRINGKAFDIYCLGKVLEHLISTQIRRMSGIVPTVRDDVNARILELKDSMLQDDVDARPTAQDVIRTIDGVC